MKENDDEDLPNLVEYDEDHTRKVPVTILIGFLGSGKTTLLNHLLTANHGKRIAVVENEFSAGLGIEGMIAKSGINGENMDNFFELNNGCICCTVKEDLLTTLEQLVLHSDRFDYILIETTGVANPGPVITTFWTDEALGNPLKLDGVVCLVDSGNIQAYLDNPDIAHDVRMQICYADRILLNKADLVDAKQMDKVTKVVREINQVAEIRQTSYSNASPDWVLDIDCYNNEISFDNIKPGTVFCQPTGISKKHLLAENVEDMTNTMRALLAENQNRGHSAASILTTHAFELDGCFDLKVLERHLDALLYSNGLKEAHGNTGGDAEKNMIIYRMKGLIRVKGKEKLFILQAVHNLFDIAVSEYEVAPEGSSESLNKIIVIGQYLNVSALEEGLEKCLDSHKI